MPVSALAEHPFDLPNEAATEALAARFAHAFVAWRSSIDALNDASNDASNATPGESSHTHRPGLQVQLNGDLGAGKTAFVRAVLRTLGHTGRVRSPTYTLVEPYQIVRAEVAASDVSSAATAILLVHHFDLYRFSDAAEWHEAGFDEYLATQAINLIEWPSRASAALGVPDLVLDIEILGDGRTLTARAFTPAGLLCLSEVSKQNLPSC